MPRVSGNRSPDAKQKIVWRLSADGDCNTFELRLNSLRLRSLARLFPSLTLLANTCTIGVKFKSESNSGAIGCNSESNQQDQKADQKSAKNKIKTGSICVQFICESKSSSHCRRKPHCFIWRDYQVNPPGRTWFSDVCYVACCVSFILRS